MTHLGINTWLEPEVNHGQCQERSMNRWAGAGSQKALNARHCRWALQQIRIYLPGRHGTEWYCPIKHPLTCMLGPREKPWVRSIYSFGIRGRAQCLLLTDTCSSVFPNAKCTFLMICRKGEEENREAPMKRPLWGHRSPGENCIPKIHHHTGEWPE